MFHLWTQTILLLTLSVIVILVNCDESPVWQWECRAGKCLKVKFNSEKADSALSLAACQVFCDEDSVVWPKPTGKLELGNYLLHINLNSVDVTTSQVESKAGVLLKEASKRFKNHLALLQPGNIDLKPGGKSVMVTVSFENADDVDLTLDTDESYELITDQNTDGRLNVTIKGKNYFGARHGLETLSQLFIYDDIRNEIQAVRNVHITDKPVYAYRGILVDTARNYISVKAIKRTIDAMAMSKLNAFHWHITDTQSFPFVSTKRPELAKYGAYSPQKVYTPNDIKDIVMYAKIRGVRIIPEFDAPAHVGEGWQNTDFVECFKKEPWHATCVEPPCGQLNPTKDGLYDVLEDIYSDMLDLFKPDIFHMGGDEVSITCWNSSESIIDWMAEKGWSRTTADFMKLWDHFQSQSLERLNKHRKDPKAPIILWTSTLTDTEYVDKYLPNTQYVIQVWTTGHDRKISDLLDRNYRLILSNYDALYFDCGFGAWVGEGNNWCSPYIGWQKVYQNNPRTISQNRVNLIVGSEAALWTEQADDSSLDNRLWPRGNALAERLWSDPSSSWQRAEQRMLIHRERIVQRGIMADTLEPLWCIQNQGSCYR